MTNREFHYRWEFNLQSSPERLWPLVADTNRFNRDTGLPSIQQVFPTNPGSTNTRRRLRLSAFGIAVEWEEEPFEWVRPYRFGVVRRYTKGPVAELRVKAELTETSQERIGNQPESPEEKAETTGTKLVYEVWARPRGLLGALAIPVQIGFLSARKFAKAFRDYDKQAAGEWSAARTAADVVFAPGGRARLLSLSEKLIANGASEDIVSWLVEHLENTDAMELANIRPYALADKWHVTRRAVLETCLWATRVGLLDLQWRLLCPLCRGGDAVGALSDISSQVHCPSCNVDFTVNFEQSVELTFRPNSAIRRVEEAAFCVGGPEVTPHIVAQQLIPPGVQRQFEARLGVGRYRLRTSSLSGAQHLRVDEVGRETLKLRAVEQGWPDGELPISDQVKISLENATDREQLFILERTAWSDQATTAAEVTALQVFRDLFAREALRSGEQISVGTLTVLFTDLKNSTKFYQEVGDAQAFGCVMNHFDVLRAAIVEEEGAIVKTIGDAVMAVFRSPAAALRAMLRAQRILACPENGATPLTLKAGLHVGPCIAVTLNDRLDYFGSTVNFAARLEGQSTGDDVIISSVVYADPEVQVLLSDGDSKTTLTATRFAIPLKGFEQDRAELWRISQKAT